MIIGGVDWILITSYFRKKVILFNLNIEKSQRTIEIPSTRLVMVARFLNIVMHSSTSISQPQIRGTVFSQVTLDYDFLRMRCAKNIYL